VPCVVLPPLLALLLGLGGDNLNLTSAEADAIVKARTASKIKDYAELSKVEGLDIKKLDPIKSRIKF
jgi:DNA uptake protein ComE-like DNA-binding protein